ncbi:MAG: hypothetical protein ACRDV7_01430 [Acidimicrobiia bacterium]
MHAIVGHWSTDAALDEDQLSHIVETVRGQEGFVRGYWGQEPGDPHLAHSFLIFETLAAARGMADAVRAAIPSASVRVIAVLADA